MARTRRRLVITDIDMKHKEITVQVYGGYASSLSTRNAGIGHPGPKKRIRVTRSADL
jgi:hypothetical protein